MNIFKNEEGKVSEGRIFAIFGKGIVAWLLVAFADTIIDNEWVLLILISALIAPKLFEKVLYMRAGGTNV